MQLKLSPWGDHDGQQLLCPQCGQPYQHFGTAEYHEGRDNYEATKLVGISGFRGSAIRIPMKGECGHNWALVLGFHKGDTVVFVGESLPHDSTTK